MGVFDSTLYNYLKEYINVKKANHQGSARTHHKTLKAFSSAQPATHTLAPFDTATFTSYTHARCCNF